MNVKNIIKVTKNEYDRLLNGETIGSQTGLSSDNLYLVEGNSVVNYWHNSLSGDGYREWSNGWVEQWGYGIGRKYSSSDTNLTFTITFKDTDYVIFVTPAEGSHSIDGAWVTGKAASQVIVHTGCQVSSTTGTQYEFRWYACGFKA